MPIRRQRYLPHVDDDDDDNYGDAREQSRAGQAGGECCCSWQQGRQPGEKAGEGGGWSAVGTVAGDDGLAVAHIAGRAIPCTIELSAGCQSSICSSSAQVVVQGEGSSEKGKGVGYRELLHPASHCCPSALRRSYTNIYAIYIEIQWSRVKKCNNLAAIFTRFSPFSLSVAIVCFSFCPLIKSPRLAIQKSVLARCSWPKATASSPAAAAAAAWPIFRFSTIFPLDFLRCPV